MSADKVRAEHHVEHVLFVSFHDMLNGSLLSNAASLSSLYQPSGQSTTDEAESWSWFLVRMDRSHGYRVY